MHACRNMDYKNSIDFQNLIFLSAVRFSRLDGFDELRDQIVINRIKELQKQRRQILKPTVED